MKNKQWNSLETLKEKSPKNREFPTNNFDELSHVDRRNFIKMAGVGVIGAGLVGCDVIRRPKQHIEPYADMPEYLVPGNKLYYATSYAIGDKVSGLLVESHEGRPTKVEGNPKHEENFGTTSVFDQSSVLDLYDPDRIKEVTFKNQKVAFSEFVNYFKKKLNNNDGKKIAIVFNYQSSPIFYKLVEKFVKKYKNITLYRYDSINNENITLALKDILRKQVYPKVDYKTVDRIISLDCDFLSDDIGELKNSRDFFFRRNPDEKMNRLYHFESSYSVTGAKADHRYMVKQSEVEKISLLFLHKIYKSLLKVSKISTKYITEIKAYLNKNEEVSEEVNNNIQFILEDILDKNSKSVFVVGKNQPQVVHQLVFYINMLLSLKNNGKVISYVRTPFRNQILEESSISSLSRLSKEIENNKVSCLVDLNVNLFYCSPVDLEIQKKVKEKNVDTIAVSLLPNQTTKNASWVLPMSHYLEEWNALKSVSGIESVVQPLVTPLYEEVLSINQFFASFLYNKSKNDHSILKEYYFSNSSQWKKALASGIFSSRKQKEVLFDSATLLKKMERKVPIQKIIKSKKNNKYSISFSGSSFCHDGRFANNAWLQELPHPITRLTWDNAVLVSNDFAKKNDLKNYDLVALKTEEGYQMEGAIWILPGQEESTITVALGYGQKDAGKIANDSGFSCEKVRTTTSFYSVGLNTIEKKNKQYILASVQDHWLIEDKIFEGKPSSNSQNNRPIHRHTDLASYQKNKSFAKDQEIVPQFPHGDETKRHAMYADDMSVFNERKYDEGYQWGMAIDLNKCSGCGACIVACQAENNIPVVGKEQVLKGREMHWLRIDRYFEGDPRDPKVLQQPISCLQCEQAPCEQVCPVAATVHSKEGLNDMVYNRCIGTRFCANNCPVKVRRYNFFDYHQRSPHAEKKVRNHLFDLVKEPPETIQMQFNPDVTVRMRGVMEKCTYCVQRINKTRIEKKNKGKKIKDGDIVTACEQACSSGGIVFGDINDKNSRVSIAKERERDYHIFGGLNLKPRTSYLAEVRNLNPSIKSKS